MGKAKRRPTKKRSRDLRSGAIFTVFLTIGGIVAFYREYWPWFAVIGAVLVCCIAFSRLRRYSIASTMTAIDRMTGPEFERFLSKLFRRLGYKTKHVGAGGGDFGADLIIEKSGMKIAVQAKNYDKNRVGNEAVQQVIAGASYYNCGQGLVVTNSAFTQAAIEQATGSNVKIILWDRRTLERVIRRGRH